MNININNYILKDISLYYGFKEVSVLTKIRGLGTSNFIIAADSSYLFLKLYEFIDESRIKGIEEITKFLHIKGIPVVLPIKNKHGLFHTSLSNYSFALYPKVQGSLLRELSRKSLESIASVISIFHSLGPECQLKLHHTKDTILPINKIISKAVEAGNIISRQDIDEKLKHLAMGLIETKIDILNGFNLEYLSINGTKKSLVHGDFHFENLLFNSKHEVAYVFDFDCVHFGHGIEDVMLFILYRYFNSYNCDKTIIEAKNFLAAYSSHHQLTITEIKLGVHYSLFKLASSLFLEEKLYKTKGLSLLLHLKWCFKSMSYLNNNINYLINQLTT